MLDTKPLEDLSNKLIALLPAELGALKQDLEKNIRLTVQTALGRLDLVTREEFDAQQAVLARTRALLQELEAKVTALEQRAKVE